MVQRLLQVSHALEVATRNNFLKCEGETAREVALFDFATTDYEMGARVIEIPPDSFFATHTHPHAYHFILVLTGTGIMIYDEKEYTLKPGDTCLVEKGVVHKLGAGKDGARVICVNTPTYEHDDDRHVHYLEDETLESVSVNYAGAAHVHEEHGHHHPHVH